MPPQHQGQGCPQKERRGRQKTQTRSLNPGPLHLHITCPLDDISRLLDEVIESVEVIDDLEINSDTRVPTKWDLHAGMKPLQGDDGTSNGELELEDNLPYGGAIEVSHPMVKMMAALGDNDKWLPWSEQKKKDTRITGEIIHPSQEIGGTHWCQGKRKSHWHGPDIAAKSE